MEFNSIMASTRFGGSNATFKSTDENNKKRSTIIDERLSAELWFRAIESTREEIEWEKKHRNKRKSIKRDAAEACLKAFESKVLIKRFRQHRN